jgi:hypothetical protein
MIFYSKRTQKNSARGKHMSKRPKKMNATFYVSSLLGITQDVFNSLA